MRVSRAEQAQAIAHDTRREWERSPSNLSFSAKKFDKFRLVEFFYASRRLGISLTHEVRRISSAPLGLYLITL